MKYLKTRGNKYYYYRRIPTVIREVVGVRFINRPLSTDKKSSIQLANRYNNIFTAIDVGIKLDQDITDLISSLNIRTIKQTASVSLGVASKSGADVFDMYLKAQDVSSNRLVKITRLLSVIQLLLPNKIESVSMATLDTVKQKLSTMPRRSTAKYRSMDLDTLVNTVAVPEERMSIETLNDHLKTLNSLLKFAYDREITARPFAVTMAKNISTAREARSALSIGSIKELVASPKTAELSSAYRLLYLSGMRLSEAFKCTVTTVDNVKCFDLTDRSIQLKTKSSYRLIPVHHSIDDPEQLLMDLRTMRKEYISRLCTKSLGEKGTLYSLRHSFATEMASGDVEPHIISELLGHSQHGMTLGRYVKGFDVKILKEAIDKLPTV